MDGPRIALSIDHGHWTAWELSAPESAFGGSSPGQALDRLIAALPDLLASVPVLVSICGTEATFRFTRNSGI